MDADLNTPLFTELAELASERVGGQVLATNDDFFASKSNLIKAGAPVLIPGKYTNRGKWMDGWESRRRRTPGGPGPRASVATSVPTPGTDGGGGALA